MLSSIRQEDLQPAPTTWPVWKRFCVRFLLCYIAVYCVGVLGDIVSFTLLLASAPQSWQTPFPALLWAHVVPWFGQHILHLGTISVSLFGSGDTLYDWVQLLCEAIVAFFAAAI